MLKRCSHLFDTSWALQIHYHHDLGKVHHQPLLAHHMTQQDSKGNIGYAFLQIQRDLISVIRIQHQVQTCYMALY